MSIIDEILKLKKEKNAVILAHYYVNDDVQDIADYIGDSYYLSKVATETDAKVIVFCGVAFMGESAKILNPEKRVFMPDATADCPMAHMVTGEKIERMRTEQEDLAVVCYINSTAEIKSHSDVCVTSANTLKIVKNLPQKNIFFVPDGNLGAYVAEQVPEKNIILNNGYCPIHAAMTKEQVLKVKGEHPKAKFAVHPECTKEVLSEADFIGSTSAIIKYVLESESQEFIIGTETGVLHEIKRNCSDKIFYEVKADQICHDMKKVTLEKVLDVLENETNEVFVDNELKNKSMLPLEKMLEMSK